MDTKLYASILSGKVNIPSSKSITHRALICSSLSVGKSIINEPLYCEDTLATLACLRNLGVDIKLSDQQIIVNSDGAFQVRGPLEAKESASTLRFLIGLISLTIPSYTFKAHPRLIERFKTSDLKVFSDLSFTYKEEQIHVEGLIKPLIYENQNPLSSQWASSLLFCLPFIKHRLPATILENDYVLLTRNIMQYFGVRIEEQAGWLIASSSYQAKEINIEVDYSSLAFFLVMSLFNPALQVGPISAESFQPDYRIIHILEKMGASFQSQNQYISCLKTAFADCSLDLSQNLDLAPLIAALASVSGKNIRLIGLKRLIYKESNRLEAIYTTLKQLGARLVINSDTLEIEGLTSLKGGVSVDGYNDHRIIMSLVAISSKIKNPFIIRGSEGVSKSFPSFFTLYKEVGGLYDSSI